MAAGAALLPTRAIPLPLALPGGRRCPGLCTNWECCQVTFREFGLLLLFVHRSPEPVLGRWMPPGFCTPGPYRAAHRRRMNRPWASRLTSTGPRCTHVSEGGQPGERPSVAVDDGGGAAL